MHFAPVAVDLDAAAQVRVQTGDARIQRARGGDEVVDARGRQSELGIGTTGADLVVVAYAGAYGMAMANTYNLRALPAEDTIDD